MHRTSAGSHGRLDRHPASSSGFPDLVGHGSRHGISVFVVDGQPNWLSALPRSGPGSVLLKQVMGMLLVAVAIWFLGNARARTFARRLRLEGNSILDFSTLADRQLSGRIANGVIHRQPAPPKFSERHRCPRFPSGLGRTIKQPLGRTG